MKEGTESDPHIIYLIALNSEKPIEEMFADYMKDETDSITPKGLDFLILKNWDKKLKLVLIIFLILVAV